MVILILIIIAQTCSTLINKNFVKTPGLIHYWPFALNQYDIIGEADMFGGVNASLTTDRFNKPDSAISLVSGYYKLPPRVYFNSSYSLLIWLKAVNDRLYQFQFLDYSNLFLSVYLFCRPPR